MEWMPYARELIGTPFHWHGRSLHGTDCLGSILIPLKKAEIIRSDFDFLDYGTRPLNLLAELQGKGAEWLEQIASPKTCDIIAYPIGGIISHLAWLDGEEIIHASQVDGVRCDARSDWAKREANAMFFKVNAQ